MRDKWKYTFDRRCAHKAKKRKHFIFFNQGLGVWESVFRFVFVVVLDKFYLFTMHATFSIGVAKVGVGAYNHIFA